MSPCAYCGKRTSVGIVVAGHGTVCPECARFLAAAGDEAWEIEARDRAVALDQWRYGRMRREVQGHTYTDEELAHAFEGLKQLRNGGRYYGGELRRMEG